MMRAERLEARADPLRLVCRSWDCEPLSFDKRTKRIPRQAAYTTPDSGFLMNDAFGFFHVLRQQDASASDWYKYVRLRNILGEAALRLDGCLCTRSGSW